MKLSLDQIFDLIDKVVIYLSQDNWLDKWKVQKGVFYYLWLYSVQNNFDFKEIAKKIEIHPDKQGPYSIAIDGEVESLVKDGYLEVQHPDSKDILIRASDAGRLNYLNEIKPNEEIYLSQIKELIEKLNSDQVIFFIYFNPYIPTDIKNFFISKSELKENFLRYKEKYIQKLLENNVIDDIVANKIRKSAINSI
jgi:hypothetical protein